MLCEQFCLGQYTRRGVRQNKLHFADSKNHWGARSVIERKPSPAPRRSLKSLEAGLALYPHFRRHISLSGPVTAAQVQAISEATGLKERQIRTLAARFRVPPVAETLAPKPRGPAVGSHRIEIGSASCGERVCQ